MKITSFVSLLGVYSIRILHGGLLRSKLQQAYGILFKLRSWWEKWSILQQTVVFRLEFWTRNL